MATLPLRTLPPLLSALFFLLSPLPAHNTHAASGPFLEKYCIDCHDSDTRKGGLDLSTLSTHFDQNGTFETWVKIHDRIASGEMPPKKKTRPPLQETQALLSGLAQTLHAADLKRRSQEGRAVFRRLTRTEYQNTLRDLLQLPHLDVLDLLPPDGQRAGFDKVGEALDLSEIQLTQYLAAAQKALDAATCTQLEAPPVRKERLYPNWIKFAQALQGGDGLLLKGLSIDPRFALVKPPVKTPFDRFQNNGISRQEFIKSNQQPVGLIRHSDPSKFRTFQFQIPTDGLYRLRISTWSFLLDQKTIRPNDRTEVASLWSRNQNLGYFEAPSLSPKIQETTAHLQAEESIRFETETVRHAGADIAEYTGPGIAIDWVEVEGPLHPQWPTPSHQALFGDLPLSPLSQTSSLPASKNQGPLPAHVTSAHPERDARQLLARFLPRAFRRPVEPDELERYLALFKKNLSTGAPFDRALKDAYQTALCSTHFLFRQEQPGPLNGNALATRLAFWLWGSTPDEPLAKAGASGQLLQPDTLHQHVERLLNDPRSQRFITDFLDQWLNLQKIGDTTPDKDLYPEFHPYLQDSMAAESRAYFSEILRENLSVQSIVTSDFAMLNGALAALYQIPNVDGHALRRVPLPKDSVRGGFITQAAVLKVTANGTTTSPVVRGAWFNERVLGLPLPPPPPNVGAVEPDTRGATTIREQLDKHRRDPSCAACHERIDPPGFALEAFDVIGGLRSHYRSLGSGQPILDRLRDGHRLVHYKQGPPVDCAGTLPNGKSFSNIQQLRARLLEDPDLLAKNLLSQLLVFATGSELHFADRPALQQLLQKSKAEQHRIRSMIHLIAQSDLFKSK